MYIQVNIMQNQNPISIADVSNINPFTMNVSVSSLVWCLNKECFTHNIIKSTDPK